MASCCASGPGSNMQKFSACRNLALSIQRFFSTNSACIIAIWPLGPPNEMNPSFNQNRNASPNDGARCRSCAPGSLSFIISKSNRRSLMFGIHDFGLFLAAGILLNLTPGPDTVYILGRSVAQGRETGIASALGICLGSIFHTCAVALGLSAILATSALAFGAIKLLGGAYLIFLGIKMVLDRRKHLTLPSNFRRRTIAAAFRQGVLTNILNPKVALFFLAFLP